MPSFKLTYFNGRGLAEIPRWLFKVAKVDFEDFRLPLSFGVPGDFSTIIRKEFDDMKASGQLAASMGKVPLLEVDGQQIAQSKAIERYLAHEFGFMGANSVEAAQIDQLCETVVDIKKAYQKPREVKDAAEKEAAMKKFFDEELPATVLLAEKSLPAGPGPFLVGSKVSLADLAFYYLLLAPKGFFDNSEGAKAAFQNCPRIKAAMDAVDQIPELQEWLKTRPDTMF